MVNKINTEQVYKIKRKSAFSLPTRPGERGMSADDVKKYLYGYVTDATNSIIEEINRIVDEINADKGGKKWYMTTAQINSAATVEHPEVIDLKQVADDVSQVSYDDLLIAIVSADGSERLGCAKIIAIDSENERAQYVFVGYCTGDGVGQIKTQHTDGFTLITILTDSGKSRSFTVKDGRPLYYYTSPIEFCDDSLVQIDESLVMPRTPRIDANDIILGSNGFGIVIKRSDGYFVQLQCSTVGSRGVPGRGIESIEELARAGLNTTYKINYTTGDSDTFDVSDGNGIDYIELIERNNLRHVHRFHFTNGKSYDLIIYDGKQGPQGIPGSPFRISKTYASIKEMNEGYESDGLAIGELVVISSNERDEDNGRLYVKDAKQYKFLFDMSGLPGIQGEPGQTPYIGENGNWYIGNDDLRVAAQGPQGQPGLTPHIGKNGNWYIGDTDTQNVAVGKDGNTPYINQDGYWCIGENVTSIRAQAKDGIDGQTPYVDESGFWCIGTQKTQYKAVGEVGQPGKNGVSPHIGGNGHWIIGETDTGVVAKGIDGLTPYVGADGYWYIGEESTNVLARAENGKDGVSPHIGENGHWFVGLQDTGIKAQGETGDPGKDGVNPHVGENGHWYIGDTDTGISASGPDVSGFVTKAVNDLEYYYRKEQIDSALETLRNQISAIPKFSIKVVSALPQSGEDATFYLLKATAQKDNLYKEYIWADSKWELIGQQEIDLSGYATTQDLENAISAFVTSTYVSQQIAQALASYTETAKMSAIARSGALKDATTDETHRVVTDAEKAVWNGKQNSLTFDSAPTAESNNPVTSGGVYNKLLEKANVADLSKIATSGSLTDAQEDSLHRTVTDAEKTSWNAKATKTDIDNAIVAAVTNVLNTPV